MTSSNFTPPTENQILLIRIFHSRKMGYAISWLVFFCLTIFFCTIYIWIKFDKCFNKSNEPPSFVEYVVAPSNPEAEDILENSDNFPINSPVLLLLCAIFIVLYDSSLYTLLMLIPVFFNLFFLKKYIFDKNYKIRPIKNILYVIATLVVAIVFALSMRVFIGMEGKVVYHLQMPWIVNAMIVLGTMWVATGLIYVRDTQSLIERLPDSNDDGEEYVEIEPPKYIELGNHNIDPTKILFLEKENNGNGVSIYLIKIGKPIAIHNTSLIKLLKKLPKKDFIQTHQSFIVAKSKIVAKLGKSCLYLLNLSEKEIPIGKKFLPDVEQFFRDKKNDQTDSE